MLAFDTTVVHSSAAGDTRELPTRLVPSCQLLRSNEEVIRDMEDLPDYVWPRVCHRTRRGARPVWQVRMQESASSGRKRR